MCGMNQLKSQDLPSRESERKDKVSKEFTRCEETEYDNILETHKVIFNELADDPSDIADSSQLEEDAATT